MWVDKTNNHEVDKQAKDLKKELNDVKNVYKKIAADWLFTKEDAGQLDEFFKETEDLKENTRNDLNEFLGDVINLSLKHRWFLISSQEDVDFIRKTFDKLDLDLWKNLLDYYKLKESIPDVEQFVLLFHWDSRVELKDKEAKIGFLGFEWIIKNWEVKKIWDDILKQLHYSVTSPTNYRKEHNNIWDIHTDSGHIYTKDILALIDKVWEWKIDLAELKEDWNWFLTAAMVISIWYANPTTRKMFFWWR